MAKFGLFQIKSMTALVIIGQMHRNPISITMKSCNGYLRKSFKINENEKCEFSLDAQLTKGGVSVEFINAEKKTVFVLNDSHRTDTLRSNEKTKFTVIFKFDNASGKFSLGWT